MNPDYAIVRIPKSGGGVRVLHVPNPTLKAEQKKILRVLKKVIFSLGPFVHGYARKRSIKTNAQSLIISREGKYWAPTYLAKMDIRDYFSNVTDRMVAECLLKEKAPGWLKDAVDRTCFIDLNGRRVLPQGAPTSPLLSAIVMKYLSFRLSGLLKGAKPWCPSRMAIYADNITFSSDDPIIYSWIPKARYILKLAGFDVRPEKVSVNKKPGRQIVCGVQINHKIGPPRAMWRNLRAELHNAWTDRMAGLVPAGYRLSDETRKQIRIRGFLRRMPGVRKKKDLNQEAREFLKGKEHEPIPFDQWRGRISFVKSLDPAKGGQLERLFKKVEDVCSRRVGRSSSTTTA